MKHLLAGCALIGTAVWIGHGAFTDPGLQAHWPLIAVLLVILGIASICWLAVGIRLAFGKDHQVAKPAVPPGNGDALQQATAGE